MNNLINNSKKGSKILEIPETKKKSSKSKNLSFAMKNGAKKVIPIYIYTIMIKLQYMFRICCKTHVKGIRKIL